MAKGRKTGGRKRGTPNHTTQEIREVIQELISTNLDNMAHWVDRVAQDNPAKAIELMIRLSEFIIPKLKSIENDNSLMSDELELIKRMIAERTQANNSAFN